MSILTTIVATGIPGFLSYIYLSQLGLLNYSKNDKDEKIIVLSIFSFLNMGISFSLFYGITGINPFEEITSKSVIPLFIFSAFISTVMTLGIYPSVLKWMFKSIENFQKKNNVAQKSSKTAYDLALFSSEYEYSFAYIFDFENKFIESGFVKRLSEEEGKLQIVLGTETAYTKEPWIFEEVLSMFNDEALKDNSAELIVDIERKIKVFVFYS